ncbi:MAG: ABC transporter substrate-binding protein/permease [Bifidobacteriaceae bacterium]|jgi:polar amino acid transport system substrate-binding protein|nr:ABC transporter substrate-binding protein/permease [Bifidobacteriaceae bacterium]
MKHLYGFFESGKLAAVMLVLLAFCGATLAIPSSHADEGFDAEKLIGTTDYFFGANPDLTDEQKKLICDTEIGVMTGSTGALLVETLCGNKNVQVYSDNMEAVAAVQAGKLEAAIAGGTFLEPILRSNPDLKYLLDVDVQTEVVVPFAAKGNDEIITETNALIDELHESGTLADMKRRWMEEGVTEMPDDIAYYDDNPIRVSITTTRAPFGFELGDGSIVGFGPEFAYRLGDKLHRKIEFIATDFAGMLSALSAGKSDIIVDSISWTEARAEVYDVGKIYYILGQRIITKNTEVVSNENFIDSVKDAFYVNLVEQDRYKLLLSGLGATLQITILAFALGTLIAFALAFLATRKSRVAQSVVSIWSKTFNSIPDVVLLMIVFYIIFGSLPIPPIIAASVAFALSISPRLTESFVTAISTVSKDQIEAAYAMGFSKMETFRSIVLPPAIRFGLPGYRASLISLFKLTSIVGFIAVSDLTHASGVIRAQTFDAFFPLIVIAVIYAFFIVVITVLVEQLEKVISYKRRRNDSD